MPIDTITCTHEDFAPFVGTIFEVSGPDGPVALKLDNVKLGSEAASRKAGFEVDGVVYPPRRMFALTFVGPQEPVLPQGTYRFDFDGSALDLFVSGFGRDGEGVLYESGFS